MPTTKKKIKKRPAKKRKDTQRKIIITAVALVLAAALAVTGIAVSHTGRKLPNPLVTLDKDKAYGVDISHHNGKVNWKTLKNEVDFAIIRVGYRGYQNGAVCIDKNAKKNLRAANDAGIPVGVYFYTQAVNEDEAREEPALML